MTEADQDRTLISRFLERRDEEAFDALYRRHTPTLWGLALRLAGGRESEAEELVQESWVRALSRLPAFRCDARLSTWLCGICTNVWRESLRRAGRELGLESADEPTTGRAPGGGSTRPELLDVRRALDGLAPGYRAVLVLHGIYGYTHAEVADMLGIAEGTSKSQLLRGRRALLAALDEREKEEAGDA